MQPLTPQRYAATPLHECNSARSPRSACQRRLAFQRLWLGVLSAAPNAKAISGQLLCIIALLCRAFTGATEREGANLGKTEAPRAAAGGRTPRLALLGLGD